MAVKEHLQRLTVLVNLIKSRPYINMESIKREMEQAMHSMGYSAATSRNTILRDIKELREDFYIEVSYCRRNCGYFIDDSEYDSIECSQVFEAFDVLNIMSTNSGILPDFIYTEPSKPKGTKHLHTLYRAIKDGRQISFTYSKYSTSAESHRTISPYAIKEQRGRWYVIGKQSVGEVRTFGLDRIENLQILGVKQELTPDFSMEDKFAHSYGIYSDESYAIENIVLSFDAEDGGYLKSVPLHPSQRVLIDTTKEFRVELRLRVTFDLIMELLSRSNSLRVIAPQSLQDRVRSIYLAAIERNK